MDVACLNHTLTQSERHAFNGHGYLVLKNVLTENQILEDVPLREWIRKHVGEEVITPRRSA